MKKLIFIGLLLAAGYFGGVELGLVPAQPSDAVQSVGRVELGPIPVQRSDAVRRIGRADEVLAEAFRSHQSNVQVQGSGQVTRVLADDNDGRRHQRFIVELASGQTLLLAHNIDLAARVNSLKVGDDVEFYGEYEWNSQGGVIHWTHRDPRGNHLAGWIKHNGRTYQ